MSIVKNKAIEPIERHRYTFLTIDNVRFLITKLEMTAMTGFSESRDVGLGLEEDDTGWSTKGASQFFGKGARTGWRLLALFRAYLMTPKLVSFFCQ